MAGRDWRDDLALAVAYRMCAMNSSLTVEEGVKQANDFMKHGVNSEASSAVLDAAFEMFKTAFGVLAPAVHVVGKMLVECVQREIANGQAIKGPLNPL